MKLATFLLVLFNLSVALASGGLIDSDCGDLENAKLKIGETEVECGSSYPLDAVSAPSIDVAVEGGKTDKLYLIAMVDPDAPNHRNPSCQSWLHFINENVQGAHLASGKPGGHIVTEYNAPTPPEGSGPHRYFVFVFEQQGELSLSNPSSRCAFHIDDFVQKENLKAIAMNMFRTHND